MNGQQIPVEYMPDPAPLGRLYPTRRDNDGEAGRHGTVPLAVSVDDFAEGDTDPGRGLIYAAGQRQEARLSESRSALTTALPTDAAMTAPPGYGPVSPVFEHAPFAAPPLRRGVRWRG